MAEYSSVGKILVVSNNPNTTFQTVGKILVVSNNPNTTFQTAGKILVVSNNPNTAFQTAGKILVVSSIPTTTFQTASHHLQTVESYCSKYQEEGKEFTTLINGTLPDGWADELPTFTPEDKGIATRLHSQTMLNALAPIIPGFWGGSAGELSDCLLAYAACEQVTAGPALPNQIAWSCP